MKCTGKEWDTCRVEKMGCKGCYYDEIEPGEYIRTKKGKITKVINIEIENYKDGTTEVFIETELNPGYLDYTSKDILKHSKSIIDLIEIGDVLKLKEGDDICYIGLEKDTTTITYSDIKESIKKGEVELLAIVTKELFKLVECNTEEV